MFRLIVVAKLDLTLVASKLAGFVKGNWMRSIQNVVPGLATNKTKTHQHAHNVKIHWTSTTILQDDTHWGRN